MSRAVGIDLGTTNSVVAVLEGGEPTVIANAEGFDKRSRLCAIVRSVNQQFDTELVRRARELGKSLVPIKVRRRKYV